MSKLLDQPRFLITTDDESLWKFDRPVIFLGAWCLNYDRKHIWKGMDSLLAAPVGLDKNSLDRDTAKSKILQEKFFFKLFNELNKHHKVNYSQRFWKILLGPWLRRYIDAMINRVQTLEDCLANHKISGTAIFANKDYLLSSENSYLAVLAFNDNRWNQELYIRILNILKRKSFPVEELGEIEPSNFYQDNFLDTNSFLKQIIDISKKKVKKLTAYLSKNNDAFIINSYLPKSIEFKLQFLLHQIPQFWSSPRQYKSSKKHNIELRNKLTKSINEETNDSFLKVMNSLIFELIPISYLEGFTELNFMTEQLPWPKDPKFIFTSNNYDLNDISQLWIAKKVESNYKYIVGQHGSNYGVHSYLGYLSIEEETCDKFLTWGWSNGIPQQVPAFVFKTSGIKRKYNSYGGLLLIERNMYEKVHTWDVTAEFNIYFEDQKKFIQSLTNQIRKYLSVRLHPQTSLSDQLRYKDINHSINFDNGSFSMNQLIKQSRLVVHSYDSTSMLELLSQNIPSIAFWKSGLDHINDNAKSYYQMLLEVGIIHLTPQSAASKINEIWCNVDGWWMQESIQEARRIFCDRYARNESKPVDTLLNILKKGIFNL